MSIDFEVAMFPDPADEKIYRERISFWEDKLTTMPSHIGWFDLEAFKWVIDEMSRCEVELLLFDTRIAEDNLTFGKLDKIRNNTFGRLHKYRQQLGIDAKKIKELTPKKKKPSNIVEALSDEDYIE